MVATRGGDIHLGLGNTNKLLARFLFEHADELALKLIDFHGGTLRNAIPREAHILLLFLRIKKSSIK